MKPDPISNQAIEIAFATSEPDPTLPGNAAIAPRPARWSEIAVYYDPAPVIPGKPWVSVVRGCSTYPGETLREEKLPAGTMERALKLVDPNSQLGRSVIGQAEEWAASRTETALQRLEAGVAGVEALASQLAGFEGETDADALAWLYGDELDKLTPAKLLERDFGVVEGTVRAAQKAGREIKVPLAAVMRFFDREAFHRARGGARG